MACRVHIAHHFCLTVLLSACLTGDRASIDGADDVHDRRSTHPPVQPRNSVSLPLASVALADEQVARKGGGFPVLQCLGR